MRYEFRSGSRVRRFVARLFGLHELPRGVYIVPCGEWDYRDARLKALEALRMHVERGYPSALIDQALTNVHAVTR